MAEIKLEPMYGTRYWIVVDGKRKGSVHLKEEMVRTFTFEISIDGKKTQSIKGMETEAERQRELMLVLQELEEGELCP